MCRGEGWGRWCGSVRVGPVTEFHSPFDDGFNVPGRTKLITRLRKRVIFRPRCHGPSFLEKVRNFSFL